MDYTDGSSCFLINYCTGRKNVHILKKISLRNKLIIVFSILAIGNLAICLYYFYNISNVVEVNQQSQEAYSEIWEISNALQKADIYMESYI